jgi:hypothetical protein
MGKSILAPGSRWARYVDQRESDRSMENFVFPGCICSYSWIWYSVFCNGWGWIHCYGPGTDLPEQKVSSRHGLSRGLLDHKFEAQRLSGWQHASNKSSPPPMSTDEIHSIWRDDGWVRPVAGGAIAAVHALLLPSPSLALSNCFVLCEERPPS